MNEIKIVSLADVVGKRKPGRYDPFIDAALKMDCGQAVPVEFTDVKVKAANLQTAIVKRGLGDKLAAKSINNVVYIIRIEDK